MIRYHKILTRISWTRQESQTHIKNQTLKNRDDSQPKKQMNPNDLRRTESAKKKRAKNQSQTKKKGTLRRMICLLSRTRPSRLPASPSLPSASASPSAPSPFSTHKTGLRRTPKESRSKERKVKAVYLDVDVLGGSPLLAEDPTLAVAEVTGGSTSRSLHRVGLH